MEKKQMMLKEVERSKRDMLAMQIERELELEEMRDL